MGPDDARSFSGEGGQPGPVGDRLAVVTLRVPRGHVGDRVQYKLRPAIRPIWKLTVICTDAPFASEPTGQEKTASISSTFGCLQGCRY